MVWINAISKYKLSNLATNTNQNIEIYKKKHNLIYVKIIQTSYRYNDYKKGKESRECIIICCQFRYYSISTFKAVELQKLKKIYSFNKIKEGKVWNVKTQIHYFNPAFK